MPFVLVTNKGLQCGGKHFYGHVFVEPVPPDQLLAVIRVVGNGYYYDPKGTLSSLYCWRDMY